MPDIQVNTAPVEIDVNNQPVAVTVSDTPVNVNIQSPEVTASVNDEPVNCSVNASDINININCCPGTGSGGATAWGDITGTLSDQTDLQAALDNKANVVHTHPLSQITQSGATDGQVPVWDNGAGEWVPGDMSGGPGGTSIVEKTYAEMQTLIAADGLTPGQWYNITDAAGTDLGFVCMAMTENEITVSGTGGYLNADFQNVGDYSGVEAETGVAAGTQLGIWRTGFEVVTITYTNLSGGNFAAGETITGSVTGATAVIVSDDGASSLTAYMTSAGVAFDGSEQLDNGAGVTADQDGAAGSPTISEGDLVIWNLLHYQLTDATLLDGTDPATNTAAYTELAKIAANVGYVTAWDISEFDFAQNDILFRSDLRGNSVHGEYLGLFQWGNDLCNKNTVADGGQIDQKNSLGLIQRNTLGKGAVIGGNIILAGDTYQNNTLDNDCQIYGNTNISASNNFLFGEAGIYTNTKGAFGGNSLFSGAVIQNTNNGDNATYRYNSLGPNSAIDGLTTIGAFECNNNILENGASLSGITTGANCSISRNKVGQGATLGGSTVLGDGAELNDFTMESRAQVTNLQLGAGASANFIKLAGDAKFWDCIMEEDAVYEANTHAVGVFFRNKTIESEVEITGNNWGISLDVAETISDNIQNKLIQAGYSNLSNTYDITGLTTLDWLAEKNYVGIGSLTSSNATEAIDQIDNFPTAFPFRIYSSAGLNITVTGTAISGIGAGQIALTTTDVVLNGDNGEWLELEADPNGGGFLREKARSGTIL